MEREDILQEYAKPVRQGKSYVVEKKRGLELKQKYDKKIENIVNRAQNQLFSESSKFYTRRRALSSSSEEEDTNIKRDKLKNLTA